MAISKENVVRFALVIIWFFGFPFISFMIDYFVIRDMKIPEGLRLLIFLGGICIWLKTVGDLWKEAVSGGFVKQHNPVEALGFTVLVLVSTPGETSQLRSTVTWNKLPERGSSVSLTSPYGDSKQYVKGEVKDILIATTPLDDGETHIITFLVNEQDFKILRDDLQWESFE